MNPTIRKFARCVILIALIMVWFCGGALASSYSCKINTTTKVYKKASTSSASMQVSKNTTCTLKKVSGNWALVERSGVSAYIPVKYLTLTNRITGYTTQKAVMYKQASSSSSQLGTLSKGTAVYINGREGSYFRCQNKSGSITGYVRMSLLSPNKPASTSSSSTSTSSSAVDKIISTAQSLLGAPYATDANPPKSFDCSRFVKYCFEQVNITLPRSAQEQGYLDGYTRITSTSSLKRGDVVVFNTVSSDDDLSDHTGIYLGNGYFIHASSSAGKVIQSTLASGYYNRVFSWGLRIAG